jgi:hypothetical protein
MTSAHVEERGIFFVQCSDVEHHACVLAVELEEDYLDGEGRGHAWILLFVFIFWLLVCVCGMYLDTRLGYSGAGDTEI